MPQASSVIQRMISPRENTISIFIFRVNSFTLEAKPPLSYKTRCVDSWVCAHLNLRALLEPTDEQYVGMPKSSKEK